MKTKVLGTTVKREDVVKIITTIFSKRGEEGGDFYYHYH